MTRIVTVEREFGAGGARVAQALAAELGWKLWDDAITEEIARRLNCKAELVEQREERLDSVFYRLMKAFMRGSFEARVETGDYELLDAEHLSVLFGKVIAGIADGGNCVIVGRGAPWFLREREDAYHVFLYAPYREKFRRLLAAGKSAREATHLLDSVDRDRAAFVDKYYGKEWPDRYLYHMMLNTSAGDEASAATILAGLRQQR